MNSKNCLSHAFSYYQPQGGNSARGGLADRNAADVVLPKAKVGLVVELDLGSGNVRLTECCDQRQQRVHGLTLDEMAEIFAGAFGSSYRRKAEVGRADYVDQWQNFLARLRKFICEEQAPPAAVKSDTEDCQEKLAELRAKVKEVYTKLTTDVGRDHRQVLEAAQALENACH